MLKALFCSLLSVPRMVAESPTPEECARRWGLIVGARKVGAWGCFVFLVGVLLILHPH